MGSVHFRKQAGRVCLFSAMVCCLIFSFIICGTAQAGEQDSVICAVYVSGIGCSNCAVTDPVLFTRWTEQFPDFIVFEYEIYQHLKDNKEIKDDYFRIYLQGERPGVPFLLFNSGQMAVGRSNVLNMESQLKDMRSNQFPSRYGFMIDFDELDLTQIPGRPNVWTKNRVLIPGDGKGGDNLLLKKLLVSKNISETLSHVPYEEVAPEPVPISGGELSFEHAVTIGSWRLQWNGESAVRPVPVAGEPAVSARTALTWMLVILSLIAVALLFLNRQRKVRKGAALTTDWQTRLKDILVAGFVVVALSAFFTLAKQVSPNALEKTGYDMPLPLFTFLIGIVDGFNPCNMFVLTCLLALLVVTSTSRVRLYVVGLSFVAMVYIFYFTFMAAWLNIFKYIGFVRPLSLTLGTVAILAGLINCKELFFFRKGVTLTVADQHKGALTRRMERMKETIQNGSFPLLISSSLGLAVLSSLVELPCTAGFPIIYTGVLTGRGLGDTWMYYAYLALYNLVYVVPLIVIIAIFIHTLRARRMTQRQMEIMKFIGGIIMLLLGLILLVNPGLIGVKIG